MEYQGRNDSDREDEPERRERQGDARDGRGGGAPKSQRDSRGRFVGCGNPNGRPKKRPSTLISGICDALDAPVSLGDGPSGKKILMSEALGMKIRKDLLKGSPKDTIAILAELKRLGILAAQQRDAELFDEDIGIYTEDDRRMLKLLKRELDEADERNDADRRG